MERDDNMSTAKHLSQVMSTAKVIPFDETSKFIIMSDCHRGEGNWGDNFSNNQNLFFTALSYYNKRSFTYIELGDGDELWENRRMKNIIKTHSDAFWLMSLFYREGRLHMIYGNHDIVKKDPRYIQDTCHSFYCDGSNSDLALFPGIEITEGLILKYGNTNDTILLAHGHQGDIINDQLWRLSRFLVRYLWKPLELIGIQNPTSASGNSEKKNYIENNLINWVENNNQMLIAGHTHVPAFPKVGEPLYFNDGCCVHPRCITGIEIANGSISLIKWSIMTRPDQLLYIGREVLEGPVELTDYFAANHKL